MMTGFLAISDFYDHFASLMDEHRPEFSLTFAPEFHHLLYNDMVFDASESQIKRKDKQRMIILPRHCAFLGTTKNSKSKLPNGAGQFLYKKKKVIEGNLRDGWVDKQFTIFDKDEGKLVFEPG